MHNICNESNDIRNWYKFDKIININNVRCLVPLIGWTNISLNSWMISYFHFSGPNVKACLNLNWFGAHGSSRMHLHLPKVFLRSTIDKGVANICLIIITKIRKEAYWNEPLVSSTFMKWSLKMSNLITLVAVLTLFGLTLKCWLSWIGMTRLLKFSSSKNVEVGHVKKAVGTKREGRGVGELIQR